MTADEDYRSIARRAVIETNVPDLLRTRSAVVLERIAMGGGNTNWYFCFGLEALEEIISRLTPGSCISFYFDDRVQLCRSASCH